ncbi:hypothetical protein HD554DRAFT_2327119 [Boletus coccyginus]|nr:hypothetical protein HD554DRAFT_2327119 [Boletus coccyginus]
MSGLRSGEYWIQLVEDPKPSVGVDPTGGVVPVITEGRKNVWTITEVEDGNYTLVLGLSRPTINVQDDNGNLVGTTDPPPTIWTIRSRVGGFTIEVPRGILPTRGWTVINPDPKEPVTIDFIKNENPQRNQLWTFEVWPGPE